MTATGEDAMKNIKSILAALCVAAMLLPAIADARAHAGTHSSHMSHASRTSGPYYGGGHHTNSHGGHYVGGQGSSHRGGHYVNPKTENHYGHHK
jgi:hypothetical protein